MLLSQKVNEQSINKKKIINFKRKFYNLIKYKNKKAKLFYIFYQKMLFQIDHISKEQYIINYYKSQNN